MERNYDFGGWATRNDLKCSDGRTIRHNAFKDCDGEEVPLVWNHAHNEPENVLGKVLLHNCDEGVYCYGTFNDTSSGQVAKVLVEHGDIKALSIYANQLKQVASDVIHGTIREVSLVHAGANPGAYIDTVIAHSDDCDEEAIIYTGESLSLCHASESEGNSDEAKASPESEPKKEEGDKEMAEKAVQDVLDSMTEEQREVTYALIAEALEDGKSAETKTDSKEEEENKDMKHNIFENDKNNNDVLMHDAMNEILADGKRYGSLKESFIAHAAEYGIENIEYLQPEDKDLYNVPPFINNQPTAWVQVVMNKVHKTPFAKVRMMFADITEDEARAKGYIKGKLKKDEVFKLLKRSVSPTTIYKKQKFDRDDLIDVDFDVVPWIKDEMNLKFDEEKARAYLFGDGRSSADDDKIDESCIIPIAKDNSLYAIPVDVNPGSGETLEHAIINAIVIGLDDYEGSGNTIAFLKQGLVSKMLIMEDQYGHRIYKDVNDLAAAMGVNQVVKVPAAIVPSGQYGLVVDLADYNVGQKNAGKKNFFDDFDIDYNQNKYLLEERQSGALTKPHSALVLVEHSAD